MFKIQFDHNKRVHLTRPEKFKENTFADAILTTQEATFKVQLEQGVIVYLTWPEKSVLLYK